MTPNEQHRALTVKLRARHPMITPTMQVTNHSTWPGGLVEKGREGWRKGRQFINKFFRDSSLSTGESCKLWGRRVTTCTDGLLKT